MYTKYRDPSFEKKFEEYLQSIVGLIRSRVGGNLVSVLLIGGYGRGEGTVMLQGNSAVPVNDIDLVVVSHRRIDKGVLKQLKVNCARVVKPDTRYVHDRYCQVDFHVDIGNLREKDLPKLAPGQFNYDLKYASMVIHGDQVLSRIPDFRSEQIPAWDGLVLLFNRCLTLAEIFSSDLITEKGKVDQADWIYYFAIKGIIDSAAALLILSGKYVPFHEERIEILKSMSGKCGFLQANPDLLPLFGEYTKKSFVIKDVDLDNPLKHWCLSSKVLLETLHYYLSEVLSIPRSNSLLEKTEGLIASRAQERRIVDRHSKSIRQISLDLLRLFKHTVGVMLYSLHFRKTPAVRPNTDYIFAAAPFLLSALNICTENGRAVAHVNQTDLVQVQKYLSSDVQRSELPDFDKQNDNGLHRWLLFRDALVDAWKRTH